MRRVLITGGAGFIGSHIAELFLAAGDQVVVIDDLSTGDKKNLAHASGIRLEVADVTSNQAAKLITDFKPEIVVHAAAQISVRESMRDPVNDARVNVLGLLNVLNSLDNQALPYFVFFSTGGALYGEQNSFPADESHPIRPESVYGASKYSSELYLELWQRAYGLKFVALRLANVYGPRQNPHGEAGVVAIFSKLLTALKVPVINGDGEQSRDFIYVSDVAEAVKAACQKRVIGAFNIGTGIETTVNTLYKAITSAHQSNVKAQYVAAKAGEQMRSVISPKLASKTFNWSAKVALEQGIKETVEWFKRQ